MAFFSLNIHTLQHQLDGRKAGLASNKNASQEFNCINYPDKAEEMTTEHIRAMHSDLRDLFKIIHPDVVPEKVCCGSTWGHEDFADNVQKQLSHWSHPSRSVSERAIGFEAFVKTEFPTLSRSLLERMLQDITDLQNLPDIDPTYQKFLKSDKAVIQRLLDECV